MNLLGEPDVSRAFQLFAQSLGGARQDAESLRRLAGQLGTESIAARLSGPRSEPQLKSWEIQIGGGAGALLAPIAIETFVGDWLQAGNLVRRGRRGLEVLVIRTPMDQLEALGLIERNPKKKIAAATEKTTSAGYGVRLLPDKEDKRLRKDARGSAGILGTLTLDLPCFGRWMPKSYWNLFQQATAHRQAAGISSEAILGAAARRRRELEGDGIVVEVNAIVVDLKEDGLVKREREDDLRAALLSHFRAQLSQRTPNLLVRAIESRTGRLALMPDIDLDLRDVARTFFVDLVQSTFAATYRTGLWPERFRSYVGREIAARIARRFVAAGEVPSDGLAIRLLDGTSRWEDERIGFETVTAEVSELLGEADDFAPVAIEDLLRADQEAGGDDD